MTQQEIYEGNLLIAKYVGYIQPSTEDKFLWSAPVLSPFKKLVFVGDNSTGFDFHSNWNSLIPAWSKYFNDIVLGIRDGDYDSDKTFEDQYSMMMTSLETGNISASFKHFIKLIEWYIGKYLTVKFYCQSHFEFKPICEEQCDHCKEYYKPIEDGKK